MINTISWATTALLLLTSVGLLLVRDWRWRLGLLAAQYVGAFWLIQLYFPVSMAAVKLVTGWMSAAALGITRVELPPNVDDESESSWPEGHLFRILAAALILLTVLPATPAITDILPSNEYASVAGGLLLIGMGLLHLGMTTEPLRVIVGILTILTGFEIIYAIVEASTLVTALLVIITLGLALVGSYLLTAGISTEEETA